MEGRRVGRLDGGGRVVRLDGGGRETGWRDLG